MTTSGFPALFGPAPPGALTQAQFLHVLGAAFTEQLEHCDRVGHDHLTFSALHVTHAAASADSVWMYV